MDYARTIGKTDELPKWLAKIQPTPFLMITDGSKVPSNSEMEDRRLINWKKWLFDRQKVYQRIECRTGRQQTDQILNSCEKVRSIVETRNLMDCAIMPVPIIPDKYRGGPEFWKTPIVLPNRGDQNLPDIAITLSKKDQNIAPELTYVGLPELIEKEKYHTDLDITSTKEYWKHSEYLKQRKEELKDQIDLLIPKEPEIKELVIEGHGFRRRKDHIRVPVITITSPSEEENDKKSEIKYEEPDLAMILKIQDREVVWNKSLFKLDPSEIKPMEWSFSFVGNAKERTEKTIVFENKGNTVIHYQWREASFRSKLMSIERHVSPFYFNKRKGLILQGQIVQLKIWYLAHSPGVSTETWKLLTDPKLSPSPLIFRFWGCAKKPISTETHDERTLTILKIDGYLDRCVRDNVVREIIDDILGDVNRRKPTEPAYHTLFHEKELFNTKNPLYNYHPTIVVQLTYIYLSVVGPDAPSWNLSLHDLREILLRIENVDLRSELLQQFSKLCLGSLEPSFVPILDYNKFEMVYNELCGFANSFEAESEYALSHCGSIDPRTIYTDREKSTDTSQVSVRSINSRKYSKRSNNRSQSFQAQEILRDSLIYRKNPLYLEVMFIRVQESLANTMDRVSAVIDSTNRLTGKDRS